MAVLAGLGVTPVCPAKVLDRFDHLKMFWIDASAMGAVDGGSTARVLGVADVVDFHVLSDGAVCVRVGDSIGGIHVLRGHSVLRVTPCGDSPSPVPAGICFVDLVPESLRKHAPTVAPLWGAPGRDTPGLPGLALRRQSV